MQNLILSILEVNYDYDYEQILDLLKNVSCFCKIWMIKMSAMGVWGGGIREDSAGAHRKHIHTCRKRAAVTAMQVH